MPSLLPTKTSAFAEQKYWNEFFRIRGETPFEWYGDYNQLGATLERYLKGTDSILHIGCGNSMLGEQLYDNGYRHTTNIDIVPDVVAKKQQHNLHTRPQMVWKCLDATKTELPDQSFTVILDKGTLDALFPLSNPEENLPDNESSESPEEVVSRLFSEMDRLLSPGVGRYVTVSLAQPHILRAWATFFADKRGYMVRVHQCMNPGEDSGTFKLPTFLLVATKFKPDLQLPEVNHITKTPLKEFYYEIIRINGKVPNGKK